MFKDRTTVTVVVVALVAIVIMGAALIASSQNKPVVGPSTAATATAHATGLALATAAVGSDMQTTASGLKYRVVTQGSGAKPTASSTVTVNYRGILTDGTEFDSSFSRGQPATFALNGVIPGWTEGLQLMTVGSTYIFTIPPQLGYGAQGYPPAIPPNATLVFQIDLISIQ